jgi:glycosyltransferase involved in cell wall biosynthesis
MAHATHKPRVSVILPVYNAERFLARAIESILAQQFTDFELIVIDDGSTDRSAEVIAQFKDRRVIHVTQQNIGLARTLNKAISMSHGALIARHDNDDLSHPQRLMKQVEAFGKYPELVLLGTAARIVDENGRDTGRQHVHPLSNHALRFHLLFDNPFVHTSVMLRREAFDRAGGYPESRDVFEDFALWSKISEQGTIMNLPDILVDYREVQSGMSRTDEDYFKKVSNQSRKNIEQLYPQANSGELSRFSELLHIPNGEIYGDEDYKKAVAFLRTVSDAFCRVNGTSEKAIHQVFHFIKSRLLRHTCNRKIHSTRTGVFLRTRARIIRRLFT